MSLCVRRSKQDAMRPSPTTRSPVFLSSRERLLRRSIYRVGEGLKGRVVLGERMRPVTVLSGALHQRIMTSLVPRGRAPMNSSLVGFCDRP